MVLGIYPAELQLNKASPSDTEADFLDLNLSIHNNTVSIKKYMINGIILILILLIFRFFMAMSLDPIYIPNLHRILDYKYLVCDQFKVPTIKFGNVTDRGCNTEVSEASNSNASSCKIDRADEKRSDMTAVTCKVGRAWVS